MTNNWRIVKPLELNIILSLYRQLFLLLFDKKCKNYLWICQPKKRRQKTQEKGKLKAMVVHCRMEKGAKNERMNEKSHKNLLHKDSFEKSFAAFSFHTHNHFAVNVEKMWKFWIFLFICKVIENPLMIFRFSRRQSTQIWFTIQIHFNKPSCNQNFTPPR